MDGLGFYGGDPVDSVTLRQMGTEAVPSGTGEVLGAGVGQGFAAGLVGRTVRAVGRYATQTGVMPGTEFGSPELAAPIEPSMEPDVANKEFEIPGHLKFDTPIQRSVAQDLYDHKREELLRQDVIDRREGGVLTGAVARTGAEFLGGAMDPLNLAVGFIPIAGEARIAALLAEAGSAAARAGVRAALGGAQGAVAMAALQPLEYALTKSEHEDYTMAQALRAIALGTVLGGGIHAAGGAIVDRLTGKYRNPVSQALEEVGPDVREGVLQGSLGQMADGRPVDVKPGLDAADAVPTGERPAVTPAAVARPPGAPLIDDPLAMLQRGELTAARAAEIRDELGRAAPEFRDRLKALAASDEAAGHLDPEIWTVIADNLAKAEASREGGLGVVADQLRYLPDDGVPKTISEREATAVIGRALDAEAARGGEVGGFLDEAALRYQAGGGEAPAEVVDAYKTRLIEAMQARQAEAAPGAAPAAAPGVGPEGAPGEAAAVGAAPPAAPLEGGIAGDVTRQLVDAGVPEAEAQAYGALQQRLFEAHAARFEGRKGSAEDIYRREGPDVVAGRLAERELQPGELGQAPSEIKGHPEGEAEDAQWRRLEPEKTADGKIRGAPEGVTNRFKLRQLRRLIQKLIAEGAPGRFWYEDSARRIMQITRGNLAEAEKLMGLVAIYSPQTPVFSNMTFAIKAYGQWKRGEPIRVKTGAQDARAQAWLERGEDWGGRKTNNFYLNLMHELDTEHPDAIAGLNIPADMLTEIKRATVDLWVLRALGYRVDAAGGVRGGAGAANKYGFSEREIQRAAGMLNKDLPEGAVRWLPHQVQAALWSAIKARYELPSVKTATWAESIRRGFAKMVPDEHGVLRQQSPGASGRERQGHMEIWRKHALAASAEDVARQIETAKGSFGDAIDRVAQNVTGEAIPSSAIGHEINNASPAAKEKFTRAALGLITDDDGNDVLAAQLGVNLNYNRLGTGAYAGDLNPVVVTTLVPEKAAGFFDATLARQYARAWQLIFKQDAVPFFRADAAADFAGDYSVRNANGRVLRRFDIQTEAQALVDRLTAEGKAATLTGGKLARGFHLEFAQDLDEAMQRRLLAALQEELGPDAGFTKTGDREVSVINYRDEHGLPSLDDERFADAIKRVVAREDVKPSKVSNFGSEGEYGPIHDWQAEPSGRGLPAAAGGSPAFQGWVRDRAEAFERLLDDWRDPERAAAGEPRLAGGEPGGTGELRAAGEPGAPRGPPELEQAGRGKIRLATEDQAKALITLFRDADASTFGHETAHDWVERLLRDAADPEAPADLVADAATVRRELGAVEGEPLTTEQHEQFAQWFEQYLREGIAPTPDLQGIFQQFRDWLVQIYQTVSGLGVPINDDIKAVFDRMLTPVERERLVEPPHLPERAPAAGEPGGPRPIDTVADINAQAAELERMQATGPERPGEVRPEAAAAAELAAEAEAQASALERAAFCISRG